MLGFNVTNRRFIDNRHYPRGFRKSGDFSIAEADILLTYGLTLQALSSGQQEAVTAEERQFVAAINGERPLETKIEKTWAKYQKLTSTRRTFHTLNSRCRVERPEQDESEDTALDYDMA